MAYSDYGAFVYLNGKRQKQLEDCKYKDWLAHGLISDGVMEVVCYKQGLPRIYKNGEEIQYYDSEKVDYFWFKPFTYELDGYEFYFENCEKPYVVKMTAPNGDVWECEYDYEYGAGFGD